MARTLRIGLNMAPSDPFWVEVCEAAAQRAQQLGIDLVPTNASDYYMQQLSYDEQALVEELLGQDLDAVIGWEFSEDLTYRVLDAGLAIIPHNSDMAIQHPLLIVREGLAAVAKILATYMAERLGGHGHVLVVGGLTANRKSGDGRGRVAGFRDTFQAYPQIHMKHLPSSWQYEHAYPQIVAALEAIPDPIDAIIGLSDSLALAARDAARVLGRLGPHTLTGGINGDPLALAAIGEGSLTATVETSASDLGHQMVNLAYQAAQGLPIPGRYTFSRMRLVTAENVAQVALQKVIDMAELPNQLVGVRRHEQQQRLTQLETSLQISRQIGSILDRWQLSQEIARLISASYGYDHAQIFLWEEAQQQLVLDQPTADPSQHLRLPLPEAGVLGQAVQRDELIFIPDTQRSPRFPPDPRWPHTRSRVVVPIHLGDRIVGVLDLHSEHTTKQTRPELIGLQSLAAQLGIAMRNAELYTQALEARAKAEVANQAKSAFLANMSHELRTPLNSILGYAQILKQRRLDPDVIHGLTTIQQSGEHLLILINDILDFAKIEAGKLEFAPAAFQLPSFLQSIADIIRVRAEKQRLIFTYTATTLLPNGIRADATRLRQVLLNLLDNAIKFTDQGQVTLRVSSEFAPFSTQHSKLNTQNSALLRFEISDTGMGIPPDQVEQLFQPFEQGGGLARRTSGTGLGLAISRQLVQLMGGQLGVESEPGRGSRFWFTLMVPVTEDAFERSHPSDRAVIGYTGPRRQVLVVDDIPSNRAVLVDMLRPIGFELAEAADGPQAIALAQVRRPELILMDLRMPGMDGHETAQQLWQLPAMRGVPLIAVSASVADDDQILSQKMGFDAFLPKPIQWPRLAALLQEHLQLEWVYDEAENVAGAAPQIASPLAAPPANELALLYEWARQGNLWALRERAAHLETLGPHMIPFAHTLYDLARSYQTKAILTLIEAYLNLEEAP